MSRVIDYFRMGKYFFYKCPKNRRKCRSLNITLSSIALCKDCQKEGARDGRKRNEKVDKE